MADKKGKSNKSQEQTAWWQPALVMFARLSGWIVAPVLLAVFFGKWLDKEFNSEPWLFLISVGVAFIISMIGITKNAVIEFKKIEREGEESKKQDKVNE